MGDIHYRPFAKEGHVCRQAANSGGTGDVCVRDSDPVAVDHEPQISLKAGICCLSGEEELVDSIDWSCEHAGSTVEGPAHVHQHLAVLDSVHFACELAGVRSKEVDWSGKGWKKEVY